MQTNCKFGANKMATKKKTDSVTMDNISIDTLQFKVSADNMRAIEALCKYAQMLDLVTNAEDDEKLSVDGVVNCLLHDASEKRLREIVKKHGFVDLDDAIQTLEDCTTADDVVAALRNAEKAAYEREHMRILAHVPIEDRQGKLFDE